MSDIYTWISATAFPALGSCWDFFKDCISDLISVVTSSRLVFIFALFLIGTIISVIVFIATSTPDLSNVDTSYPNFNLIKQRDLYFSGFHNPVRMFSKIHFKNKSKDIFKKSNLPYVTVGGYKFYNPNYKKNTNKFKAMEHDYFRSQKTAPKKRSANIDIETD